MKPLISIIIPTYNRAHLLGETLDSVLAQTYQNLECVVVDDGSFDYTEELLEFYKERDFRIKFFHRAQSLPKGANSCRNYGFKLSKGDYINWFDSDDIMLPDFLDVLLELFQDNTMCVICSGFYTDENLKIAKPILLKRNIDLYKEYLIWNQQILINSVIFRATFLRNKELFNPKITRGQEAELFSRLFYNLSKDQYSIEPSHHFLYRQHSETVSASNQVYNKRNKESEAFIYMENLSRSANIGDEELFNILFKRLVNLYFRGLENNHVENSRYILKKVFLIIFKRNPFFGLEILLVGRLLLLFRKRSYRVERRWRLKKIVIKSEKNTRVNYGNE